ncbi:hypothetical protein Emtol_4069 [Emticicia oligotrophica DSM 17448]|uniref:Circularly permuted type 2 ATP-grasp protein n=1 Tax=Emticicia oligotrophica (strain DSM 17448 / CIP 109782 / MTCC 6937 / GPTSA100-15) TaxID=929562 RepID=A0ABN4ARN4_EMTOG|nr:hypothetical protein [Emticicia oligotrophica]AFK05194.1 hypothetical protein Emtol_4069 [Emticicia oligotrophica DSM 17448]
MEPSIRDKFNESFSKEKYENLIAEIHKDFPNQLDFRVAETPVFVPKDLKIKLLQAANDIIEVILKPDFKEKTERAIPVNQYVPNENSHPHFLAIDFAVCKDEAGNLTPQLIELQGFPSLFGYQWYLGQKYRKFFYDPKNYTQYFNRLSMSSYVDEMKKVLLANENPENVILLEIYPEQQKTRLDFEITRQLWGIEPVCITKIKKVGRQLFYEKNGKTIEIKRIYNRLIFDDLLQNYPNLETNFKMTDDIEATWITHPNWFFRISKFTLPLLKSNYIPQSFYLSDLKAYPSDLENYVLKPLFSFAGSGVKLNISKEDLDKINDKENYLIQRKVQYEPVIKDVNGNLIKTEIRLLFVWEDNATRPKLVTNLARLSRGEMIGVNFNKNFDWVGGSCAFFED